MKPCSLPQAFLERPIAHRALHDGNVSRIENGIAAIDAAIKNGVSRVHVISYKLPDSILLEVFTNEGTGTLVVDDINALTPEEQAADS